MQAYLPDQAGSSDVGSGGRAARRYPASGTNTPVADLTGTTERRQASLVTTRPRPTAPILADVLEPGLRLVFCGMAAGAASAARGAYYAGPGNKFWRILLETGMTPRRMQPPEFRNVLRFGIGLTDIVKTAAGADADLPVGSYDAAGLTMRMQAFRPRMVAFNGKRAAAIVYGVPGARLGYGPGPPLAGLAPIWAAGAQRRTAGGGRRPFCRAMQSACLGRGGT